MTERQCGKEATSRIYWPGREPILCCYLHAAQAMNVAAAIGLYLHREPVVSGAEPVTCTQVVSGEGPPQ